MQSLALDVKPMRDDGARLEIAEEDDELLRAAEELGVDLSPERLRSTPRDPDVQEVEAGVEEIDLEGDLHVAADEQLTEVVVDDTEEEEDDAAPLGAVEFDLEPAEEVEVEE
jgi:DNA-directed RNA polymerase subunit beta